METPLTVTADPPARPAEPGDSVPQGDCCPHCHAARAHWVYNPFVARGRAAGGWVLWRTRICACPGSDPMAVPERRGLPPGYDNQYLDAEFGRHTLKSLTYITFSLNAYPHLTAALACCVAASRQKKPRPGLLLHGPPSAPREHLLAALFNAARAQDEPAAFATQVQAVDRSLTSRGEGWSRTAAARARRALETVPTLCLSGLLDTPATPLELKELVALLDHREAAGLLTHFTASGEARRLHERAAASHPVAATLIEIVARTTRPVAVREGRDP